MPTAKTADNKVRHIQANMGESGDQIRREMHDGAEHLVVPAVLIVEGVLNDSFVPAEEFGKYVDSWNGIPVPVLHPEEHGEHISANRPDIIDKNTIGRVYNAHVDGNKLKAELWLNIDKANRLGHDALIDQLAAGEVVELSTAYFADDEKKAGNFNGNSYSGIARNLRPDHLALLPGNVGACSVEDGCGTRTNNAKGGLKVKVTDAFDTLAKALGLRANCECNGGNPMSTENQRAEKLKALKEHLAANKVEQKSIDKLTANKKLTPEQMEMLMGMDKEALKQAVALADSMMVVEDTPDPAAMEDEEDAGMMANSVKASGGKVTINQEELDKMVANRVDEQIRRGEVMRKLTANEACAFDEKQLKSMHVDHLETYEKSIRPTDYSGGGGFASNSDAVDTNVTPLRANGVVSSIQARNSAAKK